MNRCFTVGVVAACMALATQRACLAQTNVNFLPANVASWETPTNWQDVGFGQNAPQGQFNEAAIIGSGGTAFVNTIFNNSTTVQGPGQVAINDGELEIRNGGELTLRVPDAFPLVNGIVTVGDTLNIQGNGKLNAAGITFQPTATFDVDFTAATASPVTVTGNATLAGAAVLDFSGVVNPSGTRTLLTATGNITGAFSSVDSTGLGLGKGVTLSVGSGLLTATIRDLLVLNVNRLTGAVSISNPHVAGISLDAFAVHSASGSLSPAQLTGMGAGWTSSAANSPNDVTQVYQGTLAVPNITVAGGSTTPISAPGLFDSTPSAFLEETEDLIFEYTYPTLDEPLLGVVNYIGTKVHNNIVLTINSTGNAAMLNTSPFPQEVDLYRITSTGSPLQSTTWSSLDDQGSDDGTWSESAQTSSAMLLELQEGGSTTFNSSTLYSLGKILNAGFLQEGLVFEYLLAGQNEFTQGVIEFGNLPVVTGEPGDYNNDGVVNAADYTVWRDHLGQMFQLQNEVSATTPGQVTVEDYNAWKSRFGNSGSGSASLGGSAVPEPAAWMLGMLAIAGFGIVRRRPT